MNRNVALVLYVPALHAGYIQLFEKYRGAELYILGPEILDKFPILKREIRAIDPQKMFEFLAKSGYFNAVHLATDSNLRKLVASGATVILAIDPISDWLIDLCFHHSNVIWENVFLRFSEQHVKTAYGEAQYDYQTTHDEFYQKVLEKVLGQAERSSDWFRQTATALILNDPIPRLVTTAHNQRMPSPHSSWLVGDPRMYIPYGEQPELRTTLHAEQVVIARAASDGIRTRGASILTKVYPCPDCANLIVAAAIKRVYFYEGYSALLTHETFEVYGVEVWKIE